MSSSWLIIPGEACSSSMLSDCGCPPEEAEVLRVSYLPLLFVIPELALGGVDGICNDLKEPSLVAVFNVLDFFLVSFSSSLTSSYSIASLNFLDSIL